MTRKVILWEKPIRGNVQIIIDNGTPKFLDPGQSIPEGYQQSHISTIIKFKQYLCRKARCVVKGNLVDAWHQPLLLSYKGRQHKSTDVHG